MQTGLFQVSIYAHILLDALSNVDSIFLHQCRKGTKRRKKKSTNVHFVMYICALFLAAFCALAALVEENAVDIAQCVEQNMSINGDLKKSSLHYSGAQRAHCSCQ